MLEVKEKKGKPWSIRMRPSIIGKLKDIKAHFKKTKRVSISECDIVEQLIDNSYKELGLEDEKKSEKKAS